MSTETVTPRSELMRQVDWFARALRRANKAPRTVQTYVEDATDLAAHLAKECPDLQAADLTKRHIESYLDGLWDRKLQPATVAKRFRSIQQFCKWLVEDGELAVNPMLGMKPPTVPEKPVPVIPDDAFERLLKEIIKDRKTNRFESRRDEAIFRVFVDCGLRLRELTDLTVEAIDFDTDSVRVFGKGRRWRVVPFCDDTASALQKYLREREGHSGAKKVLFQNPDDDKDVRNGERMLWLGKKGPLRYTGILQMVKRRSRAALGIAGHIHPHQLRHTAAHQHAEAGMEETEMMRLFGWRSSAMPKIYGASAADSRAQEKKRRLGIGNRYKV